MSVKIIGGGLAGLIAAHKFKDSSVQEAGPQREEHHALLRFRDKSVSQLTGIRFREVTVRKAIAIHDGQSFKLTQECNIALANRYSKKVRGVVAPSSIWSLETTKRYIAPDDFYPRMVATLLAQRRIDFNSPVTERPYSWMGEKFLNTAPLPIMLDLCQVDRAKVEFQKSAIFVARYKIANCNVHQTIYFPSKHTRTYRASITGDMLIVESIPLSNRTDLIHATMYEEVVAIADLFGVDIAEEIDQVDQKYGKIVDLPRAVRQGLLYELTREHHVYSVGRFATWRNILLDDVVKDLDVIERLMEANDYSQAHNLASEVDIPF